MTDSPERDETPDIDPVLSEIRNDDGFSDDGTARSRAEQVLSQHLTEAEHVTIEPLDVYTVKPGDTVIVDGESFVVPDPQVEVETFPEETPVFDELAGDTKTQADRLRWELHDQGYKGIRGFGELSKGKRVRLLTDNSAAAHTDGSGIILGVFRKHNSDWEREFDHPDVELMIHLDRPALEVHTVVRASDRGVELFEEQLG